MTKPLTVARKEFADGLVALINASGLPAFVIREIIKNTDTELAKVEKAQLEADSKQWQESQEGGEVDG